MTKPKFNPFRPNQVITPGMFCGRLNEIESMEKSLFQTKNGSPQHFLIEGERGIGKTSLLLYLDWLAKGMIANQYSCSFIVVNFELREGMSYEEVIGCILDNLKREISSREKLKELCKAAWNFLSGFEVAGCKYDSKKTEVSPIFDQLTETIIDILTNAGQEIDGILLLIDEADRPSSSAKLGEICKLLTERLTRRGCERLCIGLAGLPGLVTKIKEGHESAPRIFTTMPIEPLELQERHSVIESALDVAEKTNGYKTEIHKDAKELLADLSEGYPHFLQEFCYCAFDTDTDNTIDKDDVLKGAFSENGALDQLGQKYFNGLYIDQISSEDYRKVLVCMADFLDAWVKRQEIIHLTKLGGNTVDNALRALKERNIITPNPRIPGQYKLPTKSFATWIKAKASHPQAVTT